MYINLNMHILHRLPVLNTFYLYQERAKQIQSFMLLCLVIPLNLLNQIYSNLFPTWVYFLGVGLTLFPHSRDGQLSWSEHSGFTSFVHGRLVHSTNLTILASGTLLELLWLVDTTSSSCIFCSVGQPPVNLELRRGMDKRDTFLIIFGLCLLPFSNSVPLNFPALWSKEHLHLLVCLICFREASVSGNGMLWFLPTIIHWLASGCVTLNLTAVFPQVQCFHV